MNIHKSQLFWGSLGTRVLTHPHVLLYGKGTTTRTQPQSAWEWFLPAHPPPEAVSPLPGFHNWGTPVTGWFIREIPIETGDLGVHPPFMIQSYPQNSWRYCSILYCV